MADLNALKQNPELAKELSAKSLDALVCELNMRGYSVTKDELIERAKQQAGDKVLGGSMIIYKQIIIA